jgi:hypothetical protein
MWSGFYFLQMKNIPNSLYDGWSSNRGNDRSEFIYYRILTIRDIKNDYEIIPEEIKTLEEYYNIDGLGIDDPYYVVYGVYRMDVPKTMKKIGEFLNLKEAIQTLISITGNNVQESANQLPY